MDAIAWGKLVIAMEMSRSSCDIGDRLLRFWVRNRTSTDLQPQRSVIGYYLLFKYFSIPGRKIPGLPSSSNPQRL